MAGVVKTLQRNGVAASSGLSVHMMEASPFLRRVQEERLSGISKGLQVHWHESISGLPERGPFIIIAHEYFDALPIYRFHYRQDRGCWCEEMVDVEQDENAPTGPLRFVLSPQPTPATIVCLGKNPTVRPLHSHSMEVSPDSQSVMEILAKRMRSSSAPSSALIVDYGSEHTPSNSLRGIRDHAFVHPLIDSGNCDLSADVDFGALAKVARQHSLHCRPLELQRDFLERIGIDVLLTKALRVVDNDDDARSIAQGFERVVNEMGVVYRTLTVATHTPLLD